jgi:hypothetical protein
MSTERPTIPSVWFPPPVADQRPVMAGSTLPQWALAEIARVYDPAEGPVRCFPLPQHEQPPTPRAAHANRPAPRHAACLNTAVALAEPNRIAAGDSAEILSHFIRRLRTILTPGGTLAVHTHASHGPGRFTDPGGRIVLTARKVGLTYLQHIVLVHGQPQIQPTPLPLASADTDTTPPARYYRPRPIHTDLYLFATPQWSA